MTDSGPPAAAEPKAGSEPKLHHTVPQFYLERFAVDGNVELVRRDDFGKSFLISVPKALAENYFYSIDTDEGRDPLGETLIANNIETPAAEAIRRVFDNGRSVAAPGPRETISAFLAFQYVRGPRTRHALVEQYKATASKVASMATPSLVMKGARARGREMTEQEAVDAAEFARSGKYTIEVHRQANLHLQMALPAVQAVAPFFYERAWRVLEFEEPCLITSDEPVALVGSDPRTPGDAGGLKTAPQVVFPIDPRRALVMIRPDLSSEEGRFPAVPAQADIINRNVAFAGHRFLVRKPGTNPLAGLTLPKRAPAVFVVGNLIGMSTNASQKARAKMVSRARRKSR
jgi:hypothetical protein